MMTIRILIVEDDHHRFELFRGWIPEDIRVVHATSAGQAVGLLARDHDVYDGVMLDHDLSPAARTAEESRLSGQDVAHKLASTHRKRKPPVLVHSMNEVGAPLIQNILERAGFEVERVPTVKIDRAVLAEWLRYVVELAEDAGG